MAAPDRSVLDRPPLTLPHRRLRTLSTVLYWAWIGCFCALGAVAVASGRVAEGTLVVAFSLTAGAAVGKWFL